MRDSSCQGRVAGARNPSEIIQTTLCVCVCARVHSWGRRYRAPTGLSKEPVFPRKLRSTALSAVCHFLTPSTPSGSQEMFIPCFQNDAQRHEDAQVTDTVWFQILTSRVTEPIHSVNLNDTHPHIQPRPPPLRAQGRHMLRSPRPKGLSTHTHTRKNTCTCKHPSQAGSDFDM